MSTHLPPSNVVDVTALSRLFNATTNSYKFLFFQALLNLLLPRDARRQTAYIPYADLVVEMVALAWYPKVFFNLSFGMQDKVHLALDQVRFVVTDASIGNQRTQDELRDAIRLQGVGTAIDSLMRYVPTRLLTPFFANEARGLTDYKKDGLLAQLSRDNFDTRKPLYQILENPVRAIEVHPDSETYLLTSYAIVSGWSAFEWTAYLQEKNPNVPAIPNKLRPPASRSNLKAQSDYWRAIMSIAPVKCLYSNKILTPSDFALDHFIPWSFVCHDQLWNLVPVSPSANLAKSNSLPDDYYIDCFIDLQAAGLRLSRQVMSPRKWRRTTEPFVGDLHIPVDDLSDPKRVSAAYLNALPALISLAEATGFAPDWRYAHDS